MSNVHVGRQEPQLVYAYAYQVARWVKVEKALQKLIESAIPCPSCHPENDCYVFSMTALAEAGEALRTGFDEQGNNNG